MFRSNPAIIRFSSERVSVFIRSVRLCNEGEISSSVGLIITIIETVAGEEGGFCNVGIPHRTAATENRHLREHYTPSQHNIHTTEQPPPQATVSIIVIIKTTDDEISPSLHNRIDLINTDTLSDENLMMAGLGRNM